MHALRFASWTVALVACGYPALQPLPGDAPTSIDARADAATVMPITVVPSLFDLHVNDVRDSRVTVTNTSNQTSAIPVLQVANFGLGTVTFPAGTNTCTAALAPGASCTAVGHLTATVPGQDTFQISVTGLPMGAAMEDLSATVRPGCPTNCGAAMNMNCCGSSIVAGNAVGATNAGMPFLRSYDVATDLMYANTSFPAKVSDVRIDTYMVTVARFRPFVTAIGTQAATPAVGAGAHPKLPGSGWDSAWTASLPTTQAAFTTNLKCNATYQTWTDTPGANENQPINCANWYEAFAFCIWDGGYLPTEAELMYAAAGGSEQRAYPWSSPAASIAIDCSYANYNIASAGNHCVGGTLGFTNVPGAESPKGNAKWGQADLGGNLYEWLLDGYEVFTAGMCDDCANLAVTTQRVIHGGDFGSPATSLRVGWRAHAAPATSSQGYGFRCARLP